MSELGSLLLSVNSQMSAWLLSHLSQLVLIFLICLTSIYGGAVNKSVKRLLGGRSFLARTFIFIAVTGVGIGSAVIFMTSYIVSILRAIDSDFLPLFVAVVFIALGVLADRKNQI